MTCGNDVPLGDRWRPLGSDGMWPKRGQARLARGGSSAPCVADLAEARQTPAGCPRQANPPGSRLARGSPGGVWARDIPCIDGLSLASAMVVPQRSVCSNHGHDGGLGLRARLPEGERLFAPGVMELVRGWRVGFEPGPILLLEPRSWRGRLRDLRILDTRGDRWCPARIRGFRCRADPTRTRPQIPAASRPVADASGALIREWPRHWKGRASCCGIRGSVRWSGRMRSGWPRAWATVCVAVRRACARGWALTPHHEGTRGRARACR
jgi:hypothetical protein